jgi:hypothetical protein
LVCIPFCLQTLLLLPQPPESSDYRCILPCSVWFFFFYFIFLFIIAGNWIVSLFHTTHTLYHSGTPHS